MLETSFPFGRCWDISPAGPRVLGKDSRHPPSCSTPQPERKEHFFFPTPIPEPSRPAEKAGSSGMERAHPHPTSGSWVREAQATGKGGLSPSARVCACRALGSQGRRSEPQFVTEPAALCFLEAGRGWWPGRGPHPCGQSPGSHGCGSQLEAGSSGSTPAPCSVPSCGSR